MDYYEKDIENYLATEQTLKGILMCFMTSANRRCSYVSTNVTKTSTTAHEENCFWNC